MDGILEYYDGKIGTSGLVENLGYWEFIDWQEKLGKTCGRPVAAEEGPSTIINLMYGLALLKGARIAGNHRKRGPGGRVPEAAETDCGKRYKSFAGMRSRGLYREGPSYRQFSQHAQSWAVLNGL